MSKNDQSIVVAIDGPSGAGKSSTAKEIAIAADWQYLDTGALYRAFTVKAMESYPDIPAAQITETEISQVIASFTNTSISFNCSPKDPKIYLDEKDVSQAIRSPKVNEYVSYVSKFEKVREVLQNLQRTIIASAKRGIVVEGRDIGTVIAPNADLKIFLTADVKERAARRALEMDAGTQSKSITVNEVVENLSNRDALDSSRTHSPLAQSEDAYVIDSTFLSLEEVVSEIWDLLEKRGLLGLPTLVVLGRPNVGKSTLVNRLLGRREAIVEDVPGVTRDRVRYEASWNGKRFNIIDTGGWSKTPDDQFASDIVDSALGAVEEADLILLVIDAQVGALEEEQKLLSYLRSTKKPIMLIANKVDSPSDEMEAHSLWNLGAGEPQMISALHGKGAGDLLDLIVQTLPRTGSFRPDPNLHSIALVGKPNVGKSSLLNALAGANRAIVSDQAGTTRDPIDEVVEIAGKPWKLIDTAGIRKKSHTSEGSEYYASLRTTRALERAEIAVAIFDGSLPITEQDLRILSMAQDLGRALVLVINKWDLVDEERQNELDRELDRNLVQFPWIERVNLSAKTGWHKDRLAPALEKAISSWGKRIPTSALNAYVGSIVAATPPPVRGGKQPKIKFITQATICPPKFVLFATEFVEEGYRRFLERKLREKFDFTGSPVEVVCKIREKNRG